MNNNSHKIIVHFCTTFVKFYCLSNGETRLIKGFDADFSERVMFDTFLERVDSILVKLHSYCENVDNKNVRVFANGVFQQLDIQERDMLKVHVYVFHGLCFNIIDSALEHFYCKIGGSNARNGEIIHGLAMQEYRNVVVCGSFQQHLDEISKVIDILHKRHVNVLSPWTTKVIPSTLGTDFILLEGQAPLRNDRDAWYHKYEHMKKFILSDAIIICNPDGKIGQGTMFEFGFMIAFQKRIILLNEPQALSIKFPFEIGLDYQ